MTGGSRLILFLFETGRRRDHLHLRFFLICICICVFCLSAFSGFSYFHFVIPAVGVVALVRLSHRFFACLLQIDSFGLNLLGYGSSD